MLSRAMLLVTVFGLAAAPALAQQAVSARPATYGTWNNKTPAYVWGNPIAYAGDADAYVPARLIRGVPNNLFSYVTTQGNPGVNGFITSIAFRPAAGGNPPRYLFPTTPAADPNNNSLGGLIDAFNWSGGVDVVMNQCFGGGFAFNIAGSLQGATPAGGGAMIAPLNRLGYTFASAANYNEYAYGVTLPNGAAGPATTTAVGDFTQGQAYAETAPGPFALSRAYRAGKASDPFVVTGSPYGVPNQVPTAGGNPNLQAGGFESPVYGSADAPGGGGAPNDAAANNARTYATNPAHRWAVLVAFTPNRGEFSLDIQREYAALISEGVAPGHIALLFGDGTTASLARFTAIAANNNRPDVNGILNTRGANFAVPVQGAASNANLAGLLNPTIIQNPGAPLPAQMDYWQALFGTGPGGAAPVAGDSLLFYTTGHGSAVNRFGGELAAANRAVGGNVFQTDFKLDGPGNVTITPGTNITAQITLRGTPFNLASDLFLIDGNSIGTGTIAPVAPGSSLDMSPFIANTGDLTYVDITFNSEDLTPMGGSSVLDLGIQNMGPLATLEFEQDFAGFTWMDDTPSVCAVGACDLYTDNVSVPEPATWTLAVLGLGLVGSGLRGRRRAVRSA